MTEESLDIPLEVRPREYIKRLQSRGFTAAEIAELLGVSLNMIYHMKKKNCEPRWSKALILVELNALHCSTATSQPSSFKK